MSVPIGGGRLQWRGTTADHAYGASRGTARRAVQGLIRRILRHAVALPAARRFSTGLASLPILGTVFFPRDTIMRNSRGLGAALLAALMLGACSSSPEKVTPNPDSVTYEYEGDELEDVTKKAQGHCGEYGKSAQVRSVTESGDKNVAIFDCK